jgi:CBS domain-containing protein
MTVQALVASKGHAVPTIKSDTTFQDVIERFEHENAGALVVTDDNERILGIITERDIARGLKTFGRANFLVLPEPPCALIQALMSAG